MTTQEPNTLDAAIETKLAEKGMTIRDLAKAVEISYEHSRRVTKGEVIPSRRLLFQICDFLELDRNLASWLAQKSIRPTERAPRIDPRRTIVALWEQLTEPQQQDLLYLANRWARRNRAGRVASSG